MHSPAAVQSAAPLVAWAAQTPVSAAEQVALAQTQAPAPPAAASQSAWFVVTMPHSTLFVARHPTCGTSSWLNRKVTLLPELVLELVTANPDVPVITASLSHSPLGACAAVQEAWQTVSPAAHPSWQAQASSHPLSRTTSFSSYAGRSKLRTDTRTVWIGDGYVTVQVLWFPPK